LQGPHPGWMKSRMTGFPPLRSWLEGDGVAIEVEEVELGGGVAYGESRGGGWLLGRLAFFPGRPDGGGLVRLAGSVGRMRKLWRISRARAANPMTKNTGPPETWVDSLMAVRKLGCGGRGR